MEKLKNRWLIAASAVGMHVCLGSVYAYSLWINPLNALHGWQRSDIALAFSIAILFLGFSAAFLGPKVERMGPRKSGMLAGVLYSLGTFGSALAVSMDSVPLFVAFYGVIGGTGLGIGYITPVPTLVKWFPDRRGLATGMAIMGFGFGSMLFGPVIAWLCQVIGPAQALIALGCVFFCMIFFSSLYLAPPPAGWVPAGYSAASGNGKAKRIQDDIADMTAKEARGTLRFYLMWLMMFINIACGISLISIASPMAQEIAGLTVLQASSLVGFMGLLNGLGRLGWSSLSDIIGRPNTYIAIFAVEVVAYMVLASTPPPLLFQFLLLVIMTCYGGGFATLPAFLSDMFGVRQLGTIQGYMLTAWAIAGVVGPMSLTWLLQAGVSYTTAFYIFSGLLVVGFGVSLLMGANIRKLRRLKAAAAA